LVVITILRKGREECTGGLFLIANLLVFTGWADGAHGSRGILEQEWSKASKVSKAMISGAVKQRQ
jgi:hypothetical protein